MDLCRKHGAEFVGKLTNILPYESGHNLLKDRLRTSAILISLTVALLFLDSSFSPDGAKGIFLLPLLLFFSLGTAWDLASMLRGSCAKTASMATGIVTLSATIPMAWGLAGATYPMDCPVGRLGWMVIGGVIGLFLVILLEMKRYDGPDGGTIERTFSSVFASVYVGLPFAMMVVLRGSGTGNWGLSALLTMIAVTKSADAGAYFAGKSFGRRKLIPRLSPGKTWEGLAGGMVTSSLVGWLCLAFLFPSLGGSSPVSTPTIAALADPALGGIVLGVMLTIAGLIGDLSESMIKRVCGVKDSGNWLPGLGGVWDVTDSLIAAIIPAYLAFVAGVASAGASA
ncbi:MAG: phosphatidate cytidylyltransferase [Planctomycetota bacterium]